MKFALVIALSLLATATRAAPVRNAQAAIRIGCEAIHAHLPGATGNCSDFVALLRGDVWTVSQKRLPADLIGGGAPVVEVSQETGEVLNFYLTD
jgi:hypothetical protein